jgi:cell division protein FtsB
MKKVLFLIFAIVLSVILNQLILGSNGLIEGYKLRKEKEALQNYMQYLNDEKTNLDEYVTYLKSSQTNESAKEELANNMGFFDNNKKVLFRIRDNASKRVTLNIGESNTYLKEYVRVTSEVEKIQKMKQFVSALFYLVVSVFILLIVFGIENE